MKSIAQGSVELRRELTRKIENSEIDLPVLPDVASRVLALCQDPDGDPHELGLLIQRDPALAGNVLRIANSAAYAPREPIVSLQQAVSRLGMTTMGDLAIAAAVNGRTQVIKGRDAEMRTLRIHAAATAVWSREVARHRRRNVEAAFLTGLLHDVGRPIVLKAVLDLIDESPVEESVIQGFVDEFHAGVGARLIDMWKLPHWISIAIDGHHDLTRAGEHTDLAATVMLGDELAHWSDTPDAEHEAHIRALSILGPLGLYPEDIDDLLARRELVEQTKEAFA
ncbi:MAG: HDOD domain-containing protein [Planctomycetes bacterium]|nr:HDOD domain-containing protein [Planctomycetota bacterium]